MALVEYYGTGRRKTSTARVHIRPGSGAITVNRQIKALSRDGRVVERARATKLLSFRGLARVPTERAEAGDIVAIAGLEEATVADTLCDIAVETALPANPIDPGHDETMTR